MRQSDTVGSGRWRTVFVEGPTGVVFPKTDAGRSTSVLGRAVVADALRAVDPVGARSAEHETNWRHGYLGHFRRLVEAGCSHATPR
ncbi:hypothetical protein C5N14_22755 [Micromonospora sp. MW-13]|nr:hypothetical protein C5N14_22755 [Micromonospora sp. MW-13]